MIVTKPHILLVDDDEMVLRAIVRSLNLDFDCVAISKPEEALRVAQEQEFAAIVSDVSMPVMNGFQLRDAICKAVPAMKDKFLFVSGGGATPALHEQLEKTKYLPKPYTLTDLVAAIRKITG